MTAYATVEQLTDYLDQLGGGTYDVTLADILDRSTAIIDETLGFHFDGYVTPATTKTVWGWGAGTLSLPAHDIGTVTVVTLEGYTTPLTDWAEEEDGTLYRTTSYPWWGVWGLGRYTVTASWGYGDPPKSIEEVCLELAAAIWRGKGNGMWKDLGVEGSGAVSLGNTGGLTKAQLDIVLKVRGRLGAVTAI